jgi:biopolymer transport protein ExbB
MHMKQKTKLLVFSFILLVSGTFFSQVELSDTIISAPAAEATKKITEEISAFEFLMKGGFFLIPIGLLLFYTLVVMVEKFRYIRRVSKYNTHLLSEIKTNLQSGNLRPVLESLNKDQTAYGNVIREGVLTVGRPISEIESNMDKMANIEIGKMEKNINHLGLIAGIAPTLGFIGTISGVIKIFYSISITENVSIGNISGGLYEKMISSGSGLIVGIIAFAGYHLLNGMIDNYALAIQKVNLEFINLIQRPSDGHQTK